MNGYGFQLYSELRYWQPLLSATLPDVETDRDKQTVYDGRDYMHGDVPRIGMTWITGGSIPVGAIGSVTEGMNPSTLSGQGILELVSGVYTPTAPTLSDDVVAWGPDGDTEYDYTPEGSYYLEVRNASFTLLKTIPDYHGGSIEMRIGEPSAITFEISLGDDCIPYLTNDNFIVARNARDLIIDQFVIQKVERKRDGDAVYLSVIGQSQAVLLEREVVLTYSTPYTESQDETTGEPVYTREYDTVANVLQDLLDLQERSSITIADIDDDIADRNVIWSTEGVSILGAITELQQHLPLSLRGHIWVDWEGGLHWRLDSTSIAETFSVGEHVTDTTYSEDYSDMVTRVYMQGWQQTDGTRLTLPSPGYVERNTGTYGVRSIAKVDNRIRWQESLEEYAERILDEYSVPRITFSVDMINARIGTRDARDIVMATQYTIVDTPQDIDYTVAVMGITYNLSDPLDVKFDINNRNRTVADYLSTLYSQINEYPNNPLDPDWTRPTIDDIFRDLVDNPTDTWNDELIDTIGEALEQTTGGVKLAKVAGLASNGNEIEVYFWDAEASDWEESTTTIRRPYELQATWWKDQEREFVDGRTVEYDATDLDIDYQRHAVCEDAGYEFDVIEEIQPPYGIDEPLLVRRDGLGSWIDANIGGRCYLWSASSVVEQGITETVGEFPDPTDGGETTATSFIPLMFRAKIYDYNADGNRLEVYLYDYAADDWKIVTRLVYKPYALQYGSYVGTTITYLDGRDIAYDTSSLDKTYQRRATWEDDEEIEWTEVQEITPSYYAGEEIYCMMDRNGNLFDMNTGGKTWAAVGEAEETGT